MRAAPLVFAALLALAVGHSKGASASYIGENSEIHNHPWLASIQKDRVHTCSGSIVAENLVLTSANCTDSYKLSSLSVRVGSSTPYRGGSNHKVIATSSYEVSSDLGRDDAVLIKVSPDFKLSRDVRKIELASRQQPQALGTNASVPGWGWTTKLRYAKLRVVACAHKSDDHVCVTSVDRQVCQVDSGGPIVANGLQIGVMPWGKPCVSSEQPRVALSAGALRRWIEKISEVWTPRIVNQVFGDVEDLKL